MPSIYRGVFAGAVSGKTPRPHQRLVGLHYPHLRDVIATESCLLLKRMAIAAQTSYGGLVFAFADPITSSLETAGQEFNPPDEV